MKVPPPMARMCGCPSVLTLLRSSSLTPDGHPSSPYGYAAVMAGALEILGAERFPLHELCGFEQVRESLRKRAMAEGEPGRFQPYGQRPLADQRTLVGEPGQCQPQREPRDREHG